MTEKKVKVIDIHEQYKKLNRFSYRLCRFGAVMGIVAASLVIIIGVLAMLEVIPSLTFTVRSYGCAFYDYNDNVITEKYFIRGEDFELDVNLDDYTSKPDAEDGTTYTFLGWDINGDKLPDILPNRMYYSFNATPVYFEFNPYGKLKDKEEEKGEESNDSEEDNGDETK